MTMFPLKYAHISAMILAAIPAAGLSAHMVRADATLDNEEAIALLNDASTLCFGAEAPNGAGAAAANWSEYAPAEGQPLAGMLAYWKRGAALQNAELAQYILYEGLIGQRQAYVLITALEGNGGMVSASCRVLIPEDKELIAPSALEAWTGKKPTQKLIPVQMNETSWVVTGSQDDGFDTSITFLDPAIAVPAQAKMRTFPFHGTIIQFGTSEITKL